MLLRNVVRDRGTLANINSNSYHTTGQANVEIYSFTSPGFDRSVENVLSVEHASIEMCQMLFFFTI